jgi:hypothetical protein
MMIGIIDTKLLFDIISNQNPLFTYNFLLH